MVLITCCKGDHHGLPWLLRSLERVPLDAWHGRLADWTCFFLSDPSPIIGNACLSLTHSRLVNLIDMTLACEDGNSKLVEVVTVVDVDDEDRVGNSVLQIWKLRFGHEAKLLLRL